MGQLSTRTHKDIEEVLMEPRAKGVRETYFVIRADNQSITIVNPGKNGIEYNKTHGHFHTYLGAEIYNCLYGQGILIMQRNDEEGEAKEFKIVSLTSGRQVEVPSGYGHCLINVGRGYLVTLDNAPGNAKDHSYEPVKEKHGFAYFVVERKGEIAFEQNPSYKLHPQISTE